MHPLSYRLHRVSGLLLLALLAGCTQQALVPSLPEGAPADFPVARYPAQTADSQVLRITAGTLTALVYRGGRLARLGHNHVITSNAVAGLLRTDADTPANGYADLYLPLATLVVDDAAARAAAGPDFSSEPSAKDRQGTLANLLGPRLFDAAEYPYVRAAVTLERPGEATIKLSVKDHTSEHRVPVAITDQQAGYTIVADWSVTHAELGLKPFSALGGAIVVKDPIQLTLQLQADREP
ncbi:MAG: YceI family protein [Pseudomonadales bacterium]